ncbi:tRNA(Ile)-lysidine/2-thiocytidine synthase [Penicillium hordei]|uniref:tRNA(Ile)-lysidine/2-thiocytidine synthase n=1 Tax=Penicillium hordei TaxID=40994 RepID=A0AAD6EAM3_9EURO|nr:tRNA(Ile)-lysidine/2-thiocytidine synthase [Penicillium hordei]KAJ5607412.1 tRNA(Ile)-lysidine/2-thiocytidine synthase [Penicillium hordei]
MPRVTKPPVKAAFEHRKHVVTANILVAIALTERETAVINPVAGVVLVEEPSMRGNDIQLQATHCHLPCQMPPMK